MNLKGFRTILFNTAIWPPLVLVAKLLFPDKAVLVDAIAAAVVSLGNVWLRFKTDTSVGKGS